jgi:hypothetical protein
MFKKIEETAACEIRSVIHFLNAKNMKPADIHCQLQMIKQGYGEEAFGCSAVFKWHKGFAQERESLEDYKHTSQPRTVRTELRIKEAARMVRANHS